MHFIHKNDLLVFLCYLENEKPSVCVGMYFEGSYMQSVM